MAGNTIDKNWPELIAAMSAVVIAVVSLLVSLRQSQIMDRQLAASVWPRLQYDTSNQSDDGKPIISLDVENAGVGPAVIHSMSIDYKGHALHNIADLIDLCCKDLTQSVGRPEWLTSTLHHHVLIAGHTRSFLVVGDSPANKAYWQRLNTERQNLHVRICYCSVLGQCWMLDSDSVDQQTLSACPADATDDYRN